jgi:hypothetical protein
MVSMAKSNKKKYALIAVVVIVAIIAGIYFFVINPIFVAKPFIMKAALGENIAADNVNWLVNELGAYKLHASPLTGETPQMEILITDTGKKFSVITTNNMPSATESAAPTPDIRIKVDKANFAELYNSADILTKAIAMQKEGKVQIELLKGMDVLAVKGYQAIYSQLNG